MNNRLYVGSLNLSIRDTVLKSIFSSIGTVLSAKVIIDRLNNSSSSRGFGFVEMATEKEAKLAITKLHGTVHLGQAIKVSEAHPNIRKKINFSPV